MSIYNQYTPDLIFQYEGIHNIILSLFSGTPLTLEAVSPSTIILSPPEKLVLEVRATGRYNFIVWLRNGNRALPDSSAAFPVSNTDNFAHFSEIYVNNMTTMDDLGRYAVQVPVAPGLSASDGADEIEFIVIAPGKMTIYVIHRHILPLCLQMVLIQL